MSVGYLVVLFALLLAQTTLAINSLLGKGTGECTRRRDEDRAEQEGCQRNNFEREKENNPNSKEIDVGKNTRQRRS